MTLRPYTCLVFLLLFGRVAGAQQSPAERESLRHYLRGKAHADAGRHDEAIVAYEEAHAAAPLAGHLFNLGALHRLRNAPDDRRRALDYYRRFLEAEPRGRHADEARMHVAALSVVIDRPPEPEPEPEPAAVPPSAPAPPTPPRPPPAAASLIDPAPGRDGSRRALRTAGVGTAAAGVVLLGAGAYFATRASAASKELGAPGLDAWDQDVYERATGARRNARLCLGAGAAVVVGGAILYFVLGREPRVATDGLAVVATF
jgi:tetratricopeptide (TPR) repeat protein